MPGRTGGAGRAELRILELLHVGLQGLDARAQADHFVVDRRPRTHSHENQARDCEEKHTQPATQRTSAPSATQARVAIRTIHASGLIVSLRALGRSFTPRHGRRVLGCGVYVGGAGGGGSIVTGVPA